MTHFNEIKNINKNDIYSQDYRYISLIPSVTSVYEYKDRVNEASTNDNFAFGS